MTRTALPLSLAPVMASPVVAAPEPAWEGDGKRLWLTSAAIVAGLHAGILAAAVLWQVSAPQSAPPPAAMMIDMAPLAAPPTPPNDKPEGVKQEAVRPVQPQQEDLPRPEPVVKKAEVRLPKPKPKPVVTRMEEAPPAPKLVEQTTAPAAAESQAAAQPSAPMPGASPAAPSNALPTWQGVLRAHLEHHRRYPTMARMNRQEGVTFIRFSMRRDGSVITARMEKSSGYSRLDDESLALLERSQPLPPPPDEVKGETIELVVPIRFSLR